MNPFPRLVMALATLSVAAAATPADGLVGGPYIDRTKLVSSTTQTAQAWFGYSYAGTTTNSAASLALTSAVKPGQANPVRFTLVPGRQYAAFKVVYSANKNVVANINYNYLGTPKRKGTGTAPILNSTWSF